MLESSFKKKVKARLDQIPGLYYFVKEAAGLRGIPDLIICYKGRFIAWELKKSITAARPTSPGHMLQLYVIEKINISGGIGRVVYPENFEERLKELLES